MGLPSATTILSTLPGGIRATLSREGGDVATYAVRMATRGAGQLSLDGLNWQNVQNVWGLCSDFDPLFRVGDVFDVGTYGSTGTTKAFAIDTMVTCGNLVCRATVVLCGDVAKIDGNDYYCQVNGVRQEMEMMMGGARQDEEQGFYIPASTVSDVEMVTGTPVVIQDIEYVIRTVSESAVRNVLCVRCARKGKAKNG